VSTRPAATRPKLVTSRGDTPASKALRKGVAHAATIKPAATPTTANKKSLKSVTVKPSSAQKKPARKKANAKRANGKRR